MIPARRCNRRNVAAADDNVAHAGKSEPATVERKLFNLLLRDDGGSQYSLASQSSVSMSSSLLAKSDRSVVAGKAPGVCKTTDGTVSPSSPPSCGCPKKQGETLLGDVRGQLSNVKKLLQNVEQTSASSNAGRTLPSTQEDNTLTSKDSEPKALAATKVTTDTSNQLARKRGIMKEIRRLSSSLKEAPRTTSNRKDFRLHRSLPCTENEVGDVLDTLDDPRASFSSANMLQGCEEDATPFIDKVKGLQEQARVILPVSPRTQRRRLRFLHNRHQLGVSHKTKLPYLPPTPPPPLRQQCATDSSNGNVHRTSLNSKPRLTPADLQAYTIEPRSVKYEEQPSKQALDPQSARKPVNQTRSHRGRLDTDGSSALSLFSYPDEKQRDDSISVMATTKRVFPRAKNESATGRPRKDEKAQVRRSNPQQHVSRSNSTSSSSGHRRSSTHTKSPHFHHNSDEKVERIAKMKLDLDKRKKEHRRSKRRPPN